MVLADISVLLTKSASANALSPAAVPTEQNTRAKPKPTKKSKAGKHPQPDSRPPHNFRTAALVTGCFSVPMMTVFVLSAPRAIRIAFAVLMCGVPVLAALIAVRWRRTARFIFTVWLFSVAAYARSLYAVSEGSYYTSRLIAELAGQPHTFTAVSVREDISASGGMYLKLTAVDGHALIHSVQVYGYNRSGHFVHEGETLTVQARLRTPGSDSQRAPYLADWLRGRGIYGELYEITSFETAENRTAAGSFAKRLREHVLDALDKTLMTLPDKPLFTRARALTAALLFGDKSGFSADELTAFSRSGMTHLLCVSGLHISLILGGIGFVMRWLVPGRKMRVLVLGITGVLYLSMCGFAASAMRAAIMALIGALGIACTDRGRTGYGGLYPLLLAAAVMCLIRPETVFDVSFQLSVLSCMGIACASESMQVWENRWRTHPIIGFLYGALELSFAAFVFTFAYNACAFGGVSLVSPLASVLAVVPAQACLCVTWGAVLAAPLQSGVIRFIAGSVTARLSVWIFGVAQLLSALPFAYLPVTAPNAPLAVFLIMLGAAWIAALSRAGRSKLYFLLVISSAFAVILCLAVDFI